MHYLIKSLPNELCIVMFILQVGKLGFREFMLGGIEEVNRKVKSSSECKTSVYFFSFVFVYFLLLYQPDFFLLKRSNPCFNDDNQLLMSTLHS